MKGRWARTVARVVALASLHLILFTPFARASPRSGPGSQSVSGPLYSQAPSGNGIYYQSSTTENDYDQFVWDDFALASTRMITGLEWQGGYNPLYAAYAGPISEFIIRFYANSIANEPNVAGLPIVEFQTGNKANETDMGTVGNRTLFSYTYALASPITATAGITYWVEIVAFQSGIPNWELANGATGTGRHFYSMLNEGGGYSFHWGSGDTAFAVLGPLPGILSHHVCLPITQLAP